MPHSLAIHAFATGAIGGAIIAMITRTARTYGPAAHRRPVYALVLAAGALRVLGPLAMPAWHPTWILAAGICWALAFALYVAAYAAPLDESKTFFDIGKPALRENRIRPLS